MRIGSISGAPASHRSVHTGEPGVGLGNGGSLATTCPTRPPSASASKASITGRRGWPDTGDQLLSALHCQPGTFGQVAAAASPSIFAAVPGPPLGRRVAAPFRIGGVERWRALARSCYCPRYSANRSATTLPMRSAPWLGCSPAWTCAPSTGLRPSSRQRCRSRYRLEAADATHLATAVSLGADRFITNNQRDFPPAITEIHVTYPADLPDPTA
jgi:hypothetical protein